MTRHDKMERLEKNMTGQGKTGREETNDRTMTLTSLDLFLGL